MKLILLLAFFTLPLIGDVKSTTGSIQFDRDSDSTADMILNNTGLGIGVSPASNLHVMGNAIISGQIFVGGSSGSSNLNINGSIEHSFQSLSSSATLTTHSIVLADTSSDNLTLTLPSASSVTGRVYQLKKTSNLNQLLIKASDNIDAFDQELAMTDANGHTPFLNLISDGSGWYITSQSSDVTKIVASDNLIGWYRFDEGTGDFVGDSSGNRNHGIKTNFETSGNGWITSGQVNQALKFSTDDTVMLNDSYNFSASDHFSVNFWIRMDNLTNAIIIGRGTNSSYIAIYSSSYYYRNTSGEQTNQSYSMTQGEWTMFTIVADGGADVDVYINGQFDNSVDPGASGTALEIDRIGQAYSNTSFSLDGALDEIRIYNKSLSAAEIAKIYSNQQ